MSFKRALSVAVFSAVVMTGFVANASEKAAVKADGSAPVAQAETVAPDHPAVKKHHKATKHDGAAVTKTDKSAASVTTPAEQKAEVKTPDAKKDDAKTSDVKAPEVKAPEAKTGEAATPDAKADPAPAKAN